MISIRFGQEGVFPFLGAGKGEERLIITFSYFENQ
jgi:hypothetical protein